MSDNTVVSRVPAIKISPNQLAELICKYWEYAENGKPTPLLFDKIIMEFRINPVEEARMNLNKLWENNFRNLRVRVADLLGESSRPSLPDLPFTFNWIHSSDLQKLISNRSLFKHKMKNGLVPCPVYYQKYKCVVARYGNFKVSNESFWQVDAYLAALLKDTTCTFVNSNCGNAMLSGLIPPNSSLLKCQKFIAVYRRADTWFTVYADTVEKRCLTLLPKWARQNESSFALSCFIGPKCTEFLASGVTSDAITDSVVLEFVTQVLGLEVNLSPEALQARVLYNSDCLLHSCITCGEAIGINELGKVCKCCSRRIHYQCYHKDDYIPQDTLCVVCDNWDKLSVYVSSKSMPNTDQSINSSNDKSS